MSQSTNLALLKIIFDQSTDLTVVQKQRTIESLVQIAKDDPDILAFLYESLKSDQNPDIREMTADTLGLLAPDYPDVLKVLSEVLAHEEVSDVRESIVEAFGALVQTSAAARNALLLTAEYDADRELRYKAIWNLIEQIPIDDIAMTGIETVAWSEYQYSWDGIHLQVIEILKKTIEHNRNKAPQDWEALALPETLHGLTGQVLLDEFYNDQIGPR